LGCLRKALPAGLEANPDAPRRETPQRETSAEEASKKVAREFGPYDPAKADPADVDVARRLEERDSGSPAKPVIQVPEKSGPPDHVPGAKKKKKS